MRAAAAAQTPQNSPLQRLFKVLHVRTDPWFVAGRFTTPSGITLAKQRAKKVFGWCGCEMPACLNTNTGGAALKCICLRYILLVTLLLCYRSHRGDWTQTGEADWTNSTREADTDTSVSVMGCSGCRSSPGGSNVSFLAVRSHVCLFGVDLEDKWWSAPWCFCDFLFAHVTPLWVTL